MTLADHTSLAQAPAVVTVATPLDVPRYVRIIDSYPLTASGNVRKIELREQAIELVGLAAAAGAAHS